MNKIDSYDIMFVIGLALLCAGLYFAWPPAALIAPGLILIARGLLGDR